jgi:hypothetical protein
VRSPLETAFRLVLPLLGVDETGGMREAPPHISYDTLCLSSSQEID